MRDTQIPGDPGLVIRQLSRVPYPGYVVTYVGNIGMSSPRFGHK